MTSKKHKDQPAPKPNASTPIWELVIEDMKERDKLGRERYGTPLQAHNGRDALQDAYEETLDKAAYLKQAIVERDAVDHLVRAHQELLAGVRDAIGRAVSVEQLETEYLRESVLQELGLGDETSD